MNRYRCAGCGQRRDKPPFARAGLSWVCSADCRLEVVRTRSRKRAGRPRDDVPPETRNRVLARDRLRCRYCGGRVGLHLHHIAYRSEGVDHSEDNLITLCRLHHEVVHSDKRRWQPVCRAYIANLREGHQGFLPDFDRGLERDGR